MKDECYLCKREISNNINTSNNQLSYDCINCGLVTLDPSLTYFVVKLNQFEKRKLSYYFRKQKELKLAPTPLTQQNLKTFTNAIKIPANISEKMNELLLFLAGRNMFGGEELSLSMEVCMIAVYAENIKEVVYLFNSLSKLEFIEIPNMNLETVSVSISPRGWIKIEALTTTNQPSKNVFVAMSFSQELNDIYDLAIAPAVVAANYEPFRIDRKEHNNDIVDEIIIGIRQSKFMVADFTDQKNGVYFEAGFAMGLGIPVIWTCREDELKKTHFDTRQYNHITWIDKNDLKRKLENRIRATIV